MAWWEDLSLPGGTVNGHFGYVTADGPDDDENPDVLLAGGTVTFTATTPAARVDGAWLGIQPVTARVFDGQIVVAEEDLRPVRLLATDANIGVADWAWKATFKIDGFTLDPLTFKLPRDTTQNLTADLIPIKTMPYQIIEGASIVDAEVDGNGKMRFEMSDGSFTKWVDIPNGEQGIPGERGLKGDPGAPGTAATLAMGTVTAGATADAWMTGTATEKQLNLTLPRGAKGDKGDTGATGPLAKAVVVSTTPGVYDVSTDPSVGPESWLATWATGASDGSTANNGRRTLKVKDGFGILHLDFKATGTGNRTIATLPADAPTPDSLIEMQLAVGGTAYINAGSREVKASPPADTRTIVDLTGFWSQKEA